MALLLHCTVPPDLARRTGPPRFPRREKLPRALVLSQDPALLSCRAAPAPSRCHRIA